MTIFRAYDVRGLYGTELDEDKAEQIGRAFGTWIGESGTGEGSIALGRDTRISGPSLQKAFIDGVISTGCGIEGFEIIPIAILSYITRSEDLDAAAYISASHNPPEYNGIRFRTRDGYGMLYKKTGMLEILEKGSFGKGRGRIDHRSAGEAVLDYADYVSSRLSFGRRMKVVLDTGNGSAGLIPPLYEKMGLDTVVVNGSLDGTFPGRGPAPSEKTLQEASKMVVETGADYGIGFDPDADRGIIIDDLGRALPPEKVAIIIARRRYRPGDLIIAGFDCSTILERTLQPEGFRIQREKVGDVFVANTVKDSGAVLGVERSGHFFLPEFQYSDDPFAMSLAIAEIISDGERLSDLADGIPDLPYSQESIKINGNPSDVMSRLAGKLAPMNPDRTDGLKVTADDYSALIRPSNTEPLIRIYVETTGTDPRPLADAYRKMVIDSVKEGD